MSRVCGKQPSVCTPDPLTDSEVSQKLAVLYRILVSSYGPWGRLKQIHNNIGGPVLTTSSCGPLLSALPVSHPLLKLLTAAVLNHVARFGDGGLFAGLFCCSLLERARRSDLEPFVVGSVYRRLLGLCDEYLGREECGCTMKLDLGSMRELLVLVRSVVKSKPACLLSSLETKQVGQQVLKAFLLTVPSSGSGDIRLGMAITLTVEGPPPDASAAFPGLLLDVPEAAQTQSVGPLTLALFCCSLAGDLMEAGEGALETYNGTDPRAAMLELLLKLGKQLVQDGIGLLACQKVVHPQLQQYLRGRGVVVVERLGLAPMEPLTKMTGAHAIATIQTPLPFTSYGQIGGLTKHSCGPKELLHLLPAGDTAICTLLLCHRDETSLAELKVTSEKAEQVLRLALKEPYALLGGGCTETHLATYIRHKSDSDVGGATRELGCSRTEYLLAAEAFSHSLQDVARALEHDGGISLTDLSHGHYWRAPPSPPAGAQWAELVGSCGCGSLKVMRGLEWVPLGPGQPLVSSTAPTAALVPCVLDSLPAKRNALHIAVETANLIMDVKYTVQDQN